MAETNGNQYVTRAVLRAELLAVEDRMTKAIGNAIAEAIARSQAEILEKIQAFISNRQTVLLRAFERAAAFPAAAGFLTLRNTSIENPPCDKI
jgi:hypothetical protein